jgi:hypothetical protein
MQYPEGGEFLWPTRIVLTARATAKLNRAKASRKAATYTAVIIAPMLGRLQASANADIRVVSRAATNGGPLVRHSVPSI